jgi:hypothetical protein
MASAPADSVATTSCDLLARVLVCMAMVSSGCSAAAEPTRPDAPEDAARAERNGDAAAASASAPADGAAARDATISFDGAPGDAASLAPDGGRGDASALLDPAPRLSELVERFFGPTCVLGRCHTTLAPAGELSLTGRGTSVYRSLVNAPSSELPDRMRVVPYDPDASYLMEKLESDTPAVGTRMPPAMAVLPPGDIDRVRAWILAGALDD